MFLPITAVLIPSRHLPTRLWVQSGITCAFYALPKAWFWGEKTLGSIKNSNRLFRKSVRTRQNRRRLSDSDFRCVFDANGCEKPWKQGIFGVLASAVIFRQIPPSSILATWLEIPPPDGAFLLWSRANISRRNRRWRSRCSSNTCLVELNVFNASLMNDAIFKFKRYGDSSLFYTSRDKHENEDVDYWNTVVKRKKYELLFYNQTSMMDVS